MCKMMPCIHARAGYADKYFMSITRDGPRDPTGVRALPWFVANDNNTVEACAQGTELPAPGLAIPPLFGVAQDFCQYGE